MDVLAKTSIYIGGLLLILAILIIWDKIEERKNKLK